VKEADLIPPEKPKLIGLLTNQDILFGTPIPAIDKLKIVSEDEFEDIIREWIAGYCERKYIKVWRMGGAKDKGRDVVAILDESNAWDNFQCKHYNNPLMPSDIWLELGKLCYYTFNKDYTLPRKYYFVAPKGVGPTVVDYLTKPDELKKQLYLEWDKHCKEGITAKVKIPLSSDLKEHIESIDFSIFTFLDPQELIEQHKQTSYFAARFGGGLQKRTKPNIAPIEESEISIRYVEQLFEAYSDHLKAGLSKISELSSYSELFSHFNRQRECFYWAEALNEFSRDSLPTGNTCFKDLKAEIYHGVIDTSNQKHSSGYENIVKTTAAAVVLSIQSNALMSVSNLQDKVGICHHLSNENKITWVKK
jgi:hypothetical protein